MKKLYFLTLFLFSCRVYVVSKRNTAKLSEMNENKAEQQGKRNIEMTRFEKEYTKQKLLYIFERLSGSMFSMHEQLVPQDGGHIVLKQTNLGCQTV